MRINLILLDDLKYAGKNYSKLAIFTIMRLKLHEDVIANIFLKYDKYLIIL